MSIVRFLATTWDQDIFFNLVGDSGACGRCVTALADWLDILSKRTTMFLIYQLPYILLLTTIYKVCKISYVILLCVTYKFISCENDEY